jgi:putative endonuclease
MDLKNKDTGDKGEEIASDYLKKNNFIIEARNWRHKHYEVDIIASKNNLLHFVEVKTRNSLKYGHPEESITKEKMQYLKNSASAYQYQHQKWKYLQFDVIAIELKNNEVKEIFFIEDVYF